MKLDELKKLSRIMAETREPDAHKKMSDYIQAIGLNPNNFYQELEMTSRLVDTHRDVSYSNTHMQLHSHTFYELLYCCNSCDVEYLIGSDRYRLQQGDIVFVPPGISHRPLLPEPVTLPYERYVLWLSPEFMVCYASLFPYEFREKQDYTSMLRTKGTPWTHLGDLFRSGVVESEYRIDGWEAAVIGNTITLLTSLKRATDNHTARALKAEKPELLDRILAFVEKNYPQYITLETLAKEFFVSSSTISHIFKQKLGISFYRFVTQRRLIAAKNLIESGYPMETVALQTGFQDYSSFYRAFRQEYGLSPRQYRAQYTKNQFISIRNS